jgi:hypothetical protein
MVKFKMKTEIAQKISQEMNDIMARLDHSVRLVMDNCTESEFKAYRKAIGQIMGGIVLDVLNPLYDMNPEVKPVDYDDPA